VSETTRKKVFEKQIRFDLPMPALGRAFEISLFSVVDQTVAILATKASQRFA
jgi:hypothetical protein